MQKEVILFQNQKYVIVMDETSFEGISEYDKGGDAMITIRKDSVDDIEFDLKQISDAEREAYSLITPGTKVYFYAKQIGPAPYQDEPDPVKEITIECTILNPVDGIVIASFGVVDTNTVGRFKCNIKIESGGNEIYCKYPFYMNIWEE